MGLGKPWTAKLIGEAKRLHGSLRLTIAASTLYEAARRLGIRLTQHRAAEAVGVTELNLRKRVKQLFGGPRKRKPAVGHEPEGPKP